MTEASPSSPLLDEKAPASTGVPSTSFRSGRTARVPLSTKDALTMNPCEKMLKHRRPPFKLLTSITLFTLLQVIVYIYSSPVTRQDHNVHGAIVAELMGPAGYLSPGTSFVYLPTRRLSGIEDVRSALRQSVWTFYNFAASAVGNRDLPVAWSKWHNAAHGVAGNDTAFNMSWVEPPKLTLTMAQRSPRWFLDAGGTREATFELTMENPLGPLAPGQGAPSDEQRVTCAPRVDPVFGGYYLPCRGDGEGTVINSAFDGVLSATVTFHFFEDFSGPTAETNVQGTVYHWFVTQTFDFSSSPLCEMTLDVTWTVMRRNVRYIIQFLLVLCLLVAFALLDVALRVRSIRALRRHRINVFEMDAARRTPITKPPLRSPPIISPSEQGTSLNSLKASFTEPVNVEEGRKGVGTGEDNKWYEDRWKYSLVHDTSTWWHYWSLATDLIIILYGLVTFIESMDVALPSYVLDTQRIGLGIAIFGSSNLLVSYLRYLHKIFFIVQSIRQALPDVLWFLAGVLPLYFAYAAFGTVVFGAISNGQFGNLARTAVDLQALFYTDSVMEAFTAVGQTRHWALFYLSKAFCFSFLSTFMYIVNNIAIAIVLDSYSSVSVRYGLFATHKRVRQTALLRRARKNIATVALSNALDSFNVALQSLRDDGEGGSAVVPDIKAHITFEGDIHDLMCEVREFLLKQNDGDAQPPPPPEPREGTMEEGRDPPNPT